MSPPRIGLVGVGKWGQNILRDLRLLGADVYAVARTEASIARARAGGAREVVRSVDALEGVAGLIVATTIRTHAEVVLDALGLGVPIFCEKPLTDDTRAADEIVRRGGERVFVMDKWRYHPAVLELARIAARGELGEVVGLRCTRQGWGNSHRDDADDTWVLLPHDLSIALEILGHVPSPIAARGVVAEGAASISCLLGTQPWLSIEAGGMSEERRRRVELLCEGGVAWLADGWATSVGLARANEIGTPSWESRSVGDSLPLLAELRAFLEYLAGGPAPKSSAREGATIVHAVADLRALAHLP